MRSVPYQKRVGGLFLPRTSEHSNTSEAWLCLWQTVSLSWQRDVAFFVCPASSRKLPSDPWSMTWPGRRNMWFYLQNLHCGRIQSRSKVRGVCEASQFLTSLFIANVPLSCTCQYARQWTRWTKIQFSCQAHSTHTSHHVVPSSMTGRGEILLTNLCQHNLSGIQRRFSIPFLDTVKAVLKGPFIKRNFVLNGNIFRSRDYHRIPWLNGNLASAKKCSGP
jgi:hypothetical protein